MPFVASIRHRLRRHHLEVRVDTQLQIRASHSELFCHASGAVLYERPVCMQADDTIHEVQVPFSGLSYCCGVDITFRIQFMESRVPFMSLIYNNYVGQVPRTLKMTLQVTSKRTNLVSKRSS